MLQEENYSFISTGTPTYWPSDPNKLPDLLDFFVIKGISSSYTNIEPNYELSSDHTPVIATISSTPVNIKEIPKLHNAKTNWEAYRNILNKKVNLQISLKNSNEIDLATEELIRTLQEAAKIATPVYDNKTRKVNIPFEVKKLLVEKRKARRRWQNSHHPADKTIYNNLNNKLRSKLKQINNDNFANYITNLNRYDNSIWKPIKFTRKPIMATPAIRMEGPTRSKWARSNQEKSNLFAEYLATVFTPNDNIPNQDIQQYLNSTTYEMPPYDLKLFTPKEIYKEISLLNNKKAPGEDLITAKMLKEIPRKGLVLLTYIFNSILRLQYWPKKLKVSDIILVPKPGKNLNVVNSYRPISLLSILSKLLEKLLLRKITENQNIIPDHQFGFRSEHSTIQQCHRISNAINVAIDGKKYCTAAFLDVSQAFDRVWHDGLLCKVKELLPIQLYQLLKSYLMDRYFRTRVNGEISNYYPIKSGVPQGSVLGPYLYLIFTSDLPTTNNTLTGTFADDTVIMATHENPQIASSNLQDHLYLLENWMKKWKIKINETKSQNITFTLKKGKCPPVFINNIQIPEANSVKYLGIHLDSRLTWREHINKKRKQIDLRVRETYWLLGRKSRLPLENKILLYKAIIKPIWAYGIELWGCASKSNIAVLQRSQSKILRAITDAPWYVTNQMLHNDLGIPFVQDVIRDRSIKHHNRLEHHPNTLLHPLLVNRNKRLKRCWPADLT